MATDPDRLAPAPGSATRRPTGAQLGLVVGALLLLLVLVWFFLLRPDNAAVETPAAPAPITEPTPDADEAVDAPDKQDPVETFEVFAPKDPFDPLISAATAGSTAGGGTTTDGTTTDGTTTDGTTTDGTTGTTSGAPEGTTTTTTTGGGSSGEEVGGHRVRVIDVYQQGGASRAQVQVDGTVYTVDEGERFADNFELVSASGQCATMLFGDDEFTLCEGEEILK